jgi:hypothetical protein
MTGDCLAFEDRAVLRLRQQELQEGRVKRSFLG